MCRLLFRTRLIEPEKRAYCWYRMNDSSSSFRGSIPGIGEEALCVSLLYESLKSISCLRWHCLGFRVSKVGINPYPLGVAN